MGLLNLKTKEDKEFHVSREWNEAEQQFVKKNIQTMNKREYICSPTIFIKSPEDTFFKEKHELDPELFPFNNGTEYRLHIFKCNKYPEYKFRKTYKMSPISANSESKANIYHENNVQYSKCYTEKQILQLKTEQISEFPWEEIFEAKIPLQTKYKGVYNIKFYENQTDEKTIKWFESLNETEKDKLNRIMSMLDDNYKLIRNKKEYYQLEEVIVIGYCIKCLFYDEEILDSDILDFRKLITKTVHRFVDIFSKCFTMKDIPAICESENEKLQCYVIPCNNFRHRYDQRYCRDIDGYKLNWSRFIWTDDTKYYDKE